MAYGDVLHVSVRGTGDFRFEKRAEEDIDEVGFLVFSIELDIDKLQTVLEDDTRGILVRNFVGTQRHVDAGADGYALEFLVNVAADVTVIGLTGTAAYIRSRIKAARAAALTSMAAEMGREDYERAAQEVVIRKLSIPLSELQTTSVEFGTDGTGEVEILVPSSGWRFNVSLVLHPDGLREFRLRSK